MSVIRVSGLYEDIKGELKGPIFVYDLPSIVDPLAYEDLKGELKGETILNNQASPLSLRGSQRRIEGSNFDAMNPKAINHPRGSQRRIEGASPHRAEPYVDPPEDLKGELKLKALNNLVQIFNHEDLRGELKCQEPHHAPYYSPSG